MPKSKTPVSERIFEQIRDAVTFGHLKPGERLSEKRLCEEFQLSRTPLREALRKLQAQGYITLEANVGATVRKISLEEMEDIYDILSLLEPYAAMVAAARRSKEDIRTLKHIFHQMSFQSARDDYRVWVRKNDDFHNCIHMMSRRSVLSETIHYLRNRIYRFRILITGREYVENYSLEHEKILDAIISGDGKEANKWTRKHLTNVRNNRVMFLREYPELL
jgi:DNA-binding GntR family transcriptional regulator